MTASPPSRRPLIVAVVLLVFITGAFAGIAADRALAPRLRLRDGSEDMDQVLARLELTPEQRVRAESIIQRKAPRSRAVMLELADRLRLVADSVDAELRAILTPAQQLRLDSLRRDSRVLLKRKILTPRGAAVDTLIDTRQP